MSLISLDNEKAFDLYKKLAASLPDDAKNSVSLIVVQHLVPNTIPFIEALYEIFHKLIIIPKPKSKRIDVVSYFERREARKNILVLHLNRLQTSNAAYMKEEIDKFIGDGRFIILDIGGYFADSFADIDKLTDGRLVGVIEDTENGHQKYLESLQILTDEEKYKPIYSVARSPLKESEDFLVGQSIVYSVERILRDNNSLLTNKRALVLGYGKIGKSVASSLSSKNVTTWVYDIDPIRRAQALSHGYYTPEREHALPRVDLIISATGNQSLKFNESKRNCDFSKLKNNCFIASVTSADDEFYLGSMKSRHTTIDEFVGIKTIKWEDNKSFYLLNNGNAVNFTHNNTLGPYIYIVASEIVECITQLLTKPHNSFPFNDVKELTNEDRKEVAKAWIATFLETSNSK